MSGGFGGAVKLTGESSYRAALARISQNLREVGSEMKVVSSQYAKSDNSQAALTARTEALNNKMAVQKEKLSALNAQYRAMSAQYTANNTKHKELVASYDAEKQKLAQIEATLGKTSPEYQAQAKVVANLARDVDKSSAAVNANEIAMSKMRTQMNNAQADINKTDSEIKSLSPDMDKAGKAASELGGEAAKSGRQAQEASGGYTVFKNVLANLATSAIGAAVNGLKQLGSAVLNVGKQAIEAYSQNEQLVGGVQTLFKDSAGIVQDYANNAYKAAGMSANEYMNTVTGFSASLIQSLGGDTKAAAELGNTAVQDMSDNANKMGTDIESIQQTYQSLARGNYAMLDNLKLGYGGTKSEMERLMADAEKLTGEHYTIGDFGDTVKAIHAVQTQMGITGTTAKEASTTIEGSMNAMKASWQNLLAGMSDSGANMDGLINNLVDSVNTFASNIMPRIAPLINGMVQSAVQLLPQAVNMITTQLLPLITAQVPNIVNGLSQVVQAIVAALPQIMSALTAALPQIVQAILTLLPQLLDAGMQMLTMLIQGFAQALPQLITMLPTIVRQIVDVILQNLPLILQAGMELLMGLAQGLIQALPELIQMLPGIVMQITDTLLDNLPLLITAGIQILVALIQGITQAIPQLIAMQPKIVMQIVSTLSAHLPEIISTGLQMMVQLAAGIISGIGNVVSGARNVARNIVSALREAPGQVISIGKNIVTGVWEGISSSIGWLRDKVSGWVSGIMQDIKGFFGIHSPSRLMRDEVGKYLAEGIGVGFEDEMGNVSKQMIDAMPSTDAFAQTYDLGGVSAAQAASNGYGYNAQANIVDAIVDALQNVRVVLDDEVAGRFVTKTVAAAIYR
jgi:phage-related protein|nr:MAG TPA: tail tape measure protein [Caudoviricetes sp.]